MQKVPGMQVRRDDRENQVSADEPPTLTNHSASTILKISPLDVIHDSPESLLKSVKMDDKRGLSEPQTVSILPRDKKLVKSSELHRKSNPNKQEILMGEGETSVKGPCPVNSKQADKKLLILVENLRKEISVLKLGLKKSEVLRTEMEQKINRMRGKDNEEAFSEVLSLETTRIIRSVGGQ